MGTVTTPGEFAKALHERRRRDGQRKLIGLVAGGLVLVLGGLAVYLLWFSPVLAVKEVAVSGTKVLTPDEVTTAAAVPLETPLAGLDTQAIAARVRALPAVADVALEQRYPHTLAIVVTERELVYQRKSEGGFQWVDRLGTTFRTTPQAAPGAIVAVTESTDVRLLADVATVVAHLPSALRPKVTQVQAKAVDAIVLTLADGDTVVWGSADESELKAKVLATLLQVDAKVYDVSAPAYPTTK